MIRNCCTMKTTIALFLLLLNHQSYAGLFYYDSASFQADTSHLSKTFNDLESLVGTPQYPQNYPAGSGYETSSDYGIKVDLTRFVGHFSAVPAPETYILGDDVGSGFYAVDGHYALLVGRDHGDVFFDAGVYSFSANYNLDDNYYGFPGTLSAEIFYRDGTSESHTLPITYGSTMFFGLSGSELERIRFNNQYQTFDFPYLQGLIPYVLLDNIESGTITAVPEPASGIGLCLSLGFLHCISQRRRSLPAASTAKSPPSRSPAASRGLGTACATRSFPIASPS